MKINRGNLKKRFYSKGLSISKGLYQCLKIPATGKKIVFIMGCQRSGTCLMEETFRKDFNSKTYPDVSVLTDPNDPDVIRLRPLAEIKEIFDSQKANFIVAKALTETQNADILLREFPGCKIIWMYRNYKSVAGSNISHFGWENGKRDLLPIVAGEDRNWRSERVSSETRGMIKESFSNDVAPYDAAALFWYSRNVLFYDRGLNENKDVILVKYEDKVTAPVEVVRGIYSMLGIRYPGDFVVNGIHANALTRGAQIQLSTPIEELCGDLYKRLEVKYEKQKLRMSPGC